MFLYQITNKRAESFRKFPRFFCSFAKVIFFPPIQIREICKPHLTMYLVVILVASLMSLAIVSHHICPIYCFQGLFHIRTFCMQRRWAEWYMISLLAMGVPIIGGTSFRQFCSLALNILSEVSLIWGSDTWLPIRKSVRFWFFTATDNHLSMTHDALCGGGYSNGGQLSPPEL